MSIADKLVTIAENEQRVYKAGQLNVLANAESLNGSLSGEAVSANDVIGIEHNISCQLTSDTVTDFSTVKVSRYGKNLLEFKQGFLKPGTVVEYLDNGIIAQGVLSGTPGTNSYNNGWYNFSGRTSVALKSGDVVVVSADYTILELAEGYTDIKNVGVYLYGAKSEAEISSVLPSLNKTVRIYVKYTITVDGNYYPIITLNSNKVRIENVQIEVGSKSTGYEEYKTKQTITANADGTVDGITSVAPNMTLLTDTEGVVINANYYKDPDIVISNLAQSVALSGGEG